MTQKRAMDADEQHGNSHSGFAEAIFGIDRSGSTTFANAAAARILGYTVEEMAAVRFHERFHEIVREVGVPDADRCPICQALERGQACLNRPETLLHRSGAAICVELSCTPLLQTNSVTGAVICFRELRMWGSPHVRPTDEFERAGDEQDAAALVEARTRLERANEQLAEANARLAALATTDTLTGLKNHRVFQERLAEEIHRTRRYENPLSLLLVDIDDFKRFNHTHGHPEGDAVLRKVAALIEETVRTSDLAARYGGEEFAIILAETDADAARMAAERVRSAVESAEWPRRGITVSVGIATFTRKMQSGADLITGADRALYRAKQRGRNCATHVEDEAEVFDFFGGSSLPYTEIMREMLALESGMLTSAAERVKDRLIDAYDKTIESWCKILDMKDKETEGHSMRVTDLTTRLARSIEMNEEEVLYARWGALLHDIGKMGIPDSILLKPGALTDEEWVVMRRHPVIAYEMLSPITFLRPALDIPYGHHEKWDGSGYPQGLKGDDIPIAARLFAVIDVYDALRSDRPYRSGWPEDRVRAYLREQAGIHFDPRAVDAFLSMLSAEQEEFVEPLRRAA